MTILRTLEFVHNKQTLEARAIVNDLGAIQVKVYRDGNVVTGTTYNLDAELIADAASQNLTILDEALNIARTDIEHGIVAVDP
jgi:stress response protein YsnF